MRGRFFIAFAFVFISVVPSAFGESPTPGPGHATGTPLPGTPPSPPGRPVYEPGKIEALCAQIATITPPDAVVKTPGECVTHLRAALEKMKNAAPGSDGALDVAKGARDLFFSTFEALVAKKVGKTVAELTPDHVLAELGVDVPVQPPPPAARVPISRIALSISTTFVAKRAKGMLLQGLFERNPNNVELAEEYKARLAEPKMKHFLDAFQMDNDDIHRAFRNISKIREGVPQYSEAEQAKLLAEHFTSVPVDGRHPFKNKIAEKGDMKTSDDPLVRRALITARIYEHAQGVPGATAVEEANVHENDKAFLAAAKAAFATNKARLLKFHTDLEAGSPDIGRDYKHATAWAISNDNRKLQSALKINAPGLTGNNFVFDRALLDTDMRNNFALPFKDGPLLPDTRTSDPRVTFQRGILQVPAEPTEAQLKELREAIKSGRLLVRAHSDLEAEDLAMVPTLPRVKWNGADKFVVDATPLPPVPSPAPPPAVTPAPAVTPPPATVTPAPAVTPPPATVTPAPAVTPPPATVTPAPAVTPPPATVTPAPAVTPPPATVTPAPAVTPPPATVTPAPAVPAAWAGYRDYIGAPGRKVLGTFSGDGKSPTEMPWVVVEAAGAAPGGTTYKIWTGNTADKMWDATRTTSGEGPAQIQIFAFEQGGVSSEVKIHPPATPGGKQTLEHIAGGSPIGTYDWTEAP